jgi:hypothetical protein
MTYGKYKYNCAYLASVIAQIDKHNILGLDLKRIKNFLSKNSLTVWANRASLMKKIVNHESWTMYTVPEVVLLKFQHANVALYLKDIHHVLSNL